MTPANATTLALLAANVDMVLRIHRAGGFVMPTFVQQALSGLDVRGNPGGGMYLYQSAPALDRCLIRENGSEDSEIGGMDLLGSNPTLTGCTVAGNRTGYGGGAVVPRPTCGDRGGADPAGAARLQRRARRNADFLQKTAVA